MTETTAYKRAERAIKAVWVDRSVPVAETLELLENLRDEAEIRAQACRDDITCGSE